ncbi:MAG: hypothetical protein ACT4P3_17390 [Betaproteobacteria bacterium]
MKSFAALALAAALAGCGAAPFEYHPQSEIPRGPGMLSGDEGALVLRAGEPDERRDFERWKKDKAGSAEYQEFLEWREWRRQRGAQ